MQLKIGNGQKAIVRDLDYIKANKRYRWNGKLRTPLIVYSILFLLVACLVITTITDQDAKLASRVSIPFFPFILVGIAAISKYLQSLKFIDLPTGLNKQLNHDLLTSFLQQKGLLIYHHPETNDIVQIISRPLGLQDDRREALIFVIDENTILINSHFTDSGWRLTAASKHDRQMGNELMQWIIQYKNQNEKALRSS